VRHQAVVHKQMIRLIDFKRESMCAGARGHHRVRSNRSARIALINYATAKSVTSCNGRIERWCDRKLRPEADILIGNALPLKKFLPARWCTR